MNWAPGQKHRGAVRACVRTCSSSSPGPGTHGRGKAGVQRGEPLALSVQGRLVEKKLLLIKEERSRVWAAGTESRRRL